MVDPKFKAKLVEALKEIEADKRHMKLHDDIREKMYKSLKPGMSGVTRCGLCEENIVVNIQKWDSTVTLV